MRVQLRIDGDRTCGGIGDRAGRAMHELGHDQLCAHRLGGLGVRVVLARPAGAGLEILGGGLDSLAVDAQDGRPGALVTERVEDAHVLGCGYGHVEGDDRLPSPVLAELLARARICAAEYRGEVGVDHLAAQTQHFSAGSSPASRQLTAGGVVLELLLRNRLAQVPHRLLDAGELADGDHRGDPSCTGLSVRRKRLQSAYFFGTFDLEEISDATVCVSGSAMRVREAMMAVRDGRVKQACVCRR